MDLDFFEQSRTSHKYVHLSSNTLSNLSLLNHHSPQVVTEGNGRSDEAVNLLDARQFLTSPLVEAQVKPYFPPLSVPDPSTTLLTPSQEVSRTSTQPRSVDLPSCFAEQVIRPLERLPHNNSVINELPTTTNQTELRGTQHVQPRSLNLPSQSSPGQSKIPTTITSGPTSSSIDKGAIKRAFAMFGNVARDRDQENKRPKASSTSVSQDVEMSSPKVLPYNAASIAAPALATRSTDKVIADLTKSKVRSTVAPSANDDARMDSNMLDGGKAGEGASQDSDSDDEGDSERQPKIRKITERRRRLNAIAQKYITDNIHKTIEESRVKELKQQDGTEQSTKWIVKQQNTRQIISSPREYQVELFERAKEKNIIAVLDTGSGKTLIAVLLLRHIIAQELEDRAAGMKHRISFFLVDSVPLVYQQYTVLKTNLDHEMDMFCGDMGCDLWSRKRWEDHFQKNKVIVCTAEVLYQCLSKSFVTVDQVNLLIFDEAHHAKKQHSYAMIIKDFYARVPSNTTLPKIFGMTASPVDSRSDVKTAAMQLEAILHCTIATVADASLLKHSTSKAKEQIYKYSMLPLKFETPLYKEMHARFKTNPIYRRPLTYALEASRELGSWCSDQVWSSCFSDEEMKKLIAKTESRYHKKKVTDPLEVLEAQKRLIEEAQGIVKAFDFGLPDLPDFDSTRSSKNLSSKVVCLIHILRSRFERETDDKCIVFVRERYAARTIATLLAQRNIGTPHLRAATLVGARTGNAGDANFSFHEQAVTLMNFRKGIVNCLIATSVAEEGLDIPDCNLVIRFHLYTTVIQYIQSRGRARHANSRYIHMIEEHNQCHNQLVNDCIKDERILKDFCSQLPEDRLLRGNDYDIDYFLKREKTQSYTIPGSNAKLTYRTSLVVLAAFVDSLQHGPNVMAHPEYVVTPHAKQFICEVILPQAVDDNADEPPIRSAMGRPASTKQVAKCAAAFEMCKLLRQGKYIDEYLTPKYRDQLPLMRNAQLAVDSKKREAYKMRTKPAMWSIEGEPTSLFVTVLFIANPDALDRPSQPMALLTRQELPRLPSFMLHFGPDRHSPAVCTALSRPLEVSSIVLDQINLFTLCVFDDVFSKEYEPDASRMPYFLLPIRQEVVFDTDTDPSSLVDWAVVAAVKQHQLDTVDKPWENYTWHDKPDDYYRQKFLVDPWDGSRKFWSVGRSDKYKALDPLPPDTPARSGTRRNNDNILEYSISLWAKARSRRSFAEDQPVVEAELISLRRNMLDEFGTMENEAPKKCFLVLEPLKVSLLPCPAVAMAFILPAIIHRVESYLIAIEVFELLHLKVRPDLALEAVTKDSDNTGDHSDEQINFQRGMGKNYERLELLGDSFLKLATSISLYGLHPDNDEFSYHVDRMLLICNKNLRDNAIKLKLFEFIRSQSFNRRAWYPEGLVLKKGKKATAPNFHQLGDKAVADVCEAIIGAAYLNSYESKDMDPAVRAVTELVCSANHSMMSWSDYYKMYTKPAYQTRKATQAQLHLAAQVETQHAYHFKWPLLLRSAFIHASYPYAYEKIPSYQRLEFLGDAILDMACVNYLFHTFPDKDPQWLTEHKMAMVSNQFLGALCVALGFHKHLLVFNPAVQRHITDYATDITEARREAEEDAVQSGKRPEDCAPDYWTAVRQPPKCLPDIVEAYVGAVFVDSEYDYNEVERFFNAHVLWFFQDMSIYDTFANKHPTTFLTKFLQESMGCANWDISSHEVPGIDGRKPMVTSVVIVHDEVVASATAESSRYAKIAAARKAQELLNGLPLPEFRAKFGCGCKGVDAGDLDGVERGTAV